MSATYLALVQIYVTDGTRVSGAGAVTVVKAAGWVVVAGAVMKARMLIACDGRSLCTVDSGPRRHAQAEVGPRHIDTLTYILTH